MFILVIIYIYVLYLEFLMLDFLEGMMNWVGNNVKYGNGKVSIKDWICCVQWNWFIMIMVGCFFLINSLMQVKLIMLQVIGGVVNVFYLIFYELCWLIGIGFVFYFFNICLFIMNCVLILLWFYWWLGSFVELFMDQMELLFIFFFVSSIIFYCELVFEWLCNILFFFYF